MVGHATSCGLRRTDSDMWFSSFVCCFKRTVWAPRTPCKRLAVYYRLHLAPQALSVSSQPCSLQASVWGAYVVKSCRDLPEFCSSCKIFIPKQRTFQNVRVSDLKAPNVVLPSVPEFRYGGFRKLFGGPCNKDPPI